MGRVKVLGTTIADMISAVVSGVDVEGGIDEVDIVAMGSKEEPRDTIPAPPPEGCENDDTVPSGSVLVEELEPESER